MDYIEKMIDAVIVEISRRSEDELIDLYVKYYPHLVAMADRREDPRARKALGDAMANLKYPPGISGPEALTISNIGG